MSLLSASGSPFETRRVALVLALVLSCVVSHRPDLLSCTAGFLSLARLLCLFSSSPLSRTDLETTPVTSSHPSLQTCRPLDFCSRGGCLNAVAQCFQQCHSRHFFLRALSLFIHQTKFIGVRFCEIILLLLHMYTFNLGTLYNLSVTVISLVSVPLKVSQLEAGEDRRPFYPLEGIRFFSPTQGSHHLPPHCNMLVKVCK